MNELRKEIMEIRKEMSQQQDRMTVDMRSLSNTLSLPFSSVDSVILDDVQITREFTRTENSHAIVSQGLWHEATVAVKTFKKCVTGYDARYDWLKLAERWSCLRHPNILPVSSSIGFDD